EVLVSRHAAAMVEEDALDAASFRETVLPLLKDSALRAGLAERAQQMGRPDAADRVARLVLETMQSGRRR
ncbi:MAG: UDP-N-acetylglucosamine--N-acetylmuramyl-(pentapeptide) pyrophosphoryl-undecaprenol N-acetylglucosamine transferase, partial [Planctomycetota bacterium]